MACDHIRSMALEFAAAPFRLLFKHPFGTSHGLRDGTDSVFIRLSDGSHVGYGEVTLPPYLKEKPVDVFERLRTIAKHTWLDPVQLLDQLDAIGVFNEGGYGCRAGLHMAAIDLLGKQRHVSAKQLLGIKDRKLPITLVTLGTTKATDIEQKISELPRSGALKVKVSGIEDQLTIARINELDDRRLFLDGNQGLADLEQAIALARAVGVDRLLGFEEPFAPGRPDLCSELAHRTGQVVYADESAQRAADIGSAAAWYGGVNLKLMKCGGLDQAMAGIQEAQQRRMKVMLGSMSESSLGCTAMAQLAGQADLVDLDGPWLLKNDPFKGLGMENGALTLKRGPGLGVTLEADLPFSSIGA